MLSIALKFGRRYLSNQDRVDIPSLLRQVTKDKFFIKYNRSSGAGGQSVNKLSTKAELRLELRKASWIPQQVLDILRKQEKSLINKNDELIVTSEKTRSQHKNLEDALGKVRQMLNMAAFVPKETSQETIERVKKYKRRGNEKRIDNKRIKSAKKVDRKNIE